MDLVVHGFHTLLAFLAALLLLITVHEWGHFWVANRLGVKVLRFSVGFGKPLWSIRRGQDQTEWAIGAFPLGGYVKMLDEREGEVAPYELDRAFNRQPLWIRSCIVVAGPLANFLLAFLLYWALYWVGIPGLKPYLGTPPAGSIAATAGFVAGERILSLDGKPVDSWSSLQLMLVDHALSGDRVELEAMDNQHHVTRHALDLSGATDIHKADELMDRIGLVPWDFPIPARVGQILPDSPASRAGFRGGDRILSVNDRPVENWQALVHVVQASPGIPLLVKVERAGQTVSLNVTPLVEGTSSHKTGKIGVSPWLDPELEQRYWTTVRKPVVAAAETALARTWEITALTFRTFGAMFLGRASWDNVGGPIQIASYAGQAAQMGMTAYFSFLALISVSLGALNLLPVPLLDGGYLMYHAVEWLKGSPLSDEAMVLTQRVGLALLAALMGFALYNDIQRLLIN